MHLPLIDTEDDQSSYYYNQQHHNNHRNYYDDNSGITVIITSHYSEQNRWCTITLLTTIQYIIAITIHVYTSQSVR